MSRTSQPALWVVTSYLKDQDVVANLGSWYVRDVESGDGVDGTDSPNAMEALRSGLRRATEQGLRLINVFPLGQEIVIVVSREA